MSKRKKRLEKIRRSQKDVSFEELRQVLQDYQFTLGSVNGSHHNFKRKVGNETLQVTIPYRRPVKDHYVKQVIETLDRLIRLENTTEDKNDDDTDTTRE